MSQFSDQDIAILERTAIADPKAMVLIAALSADDFKALAQQSLNRRMSFVFELMSTEALQAIAKGDLNMAQTCQTMLAPRG